MRFLLNLWKPKSKTEKVINIIVRIMAISMFFAFLILPFVKFNDKSNDIFKWVWIGCAICNIDILVCYKKYNKKKLISPVFLLFSVLTLTYLYNYWALLSIAIIVCVSIVIGVLEFIVSVSIYKTIRFSEQAVENELPLKVIQGIVLGGLYICAVILFALGHHISKNIIFAFGIVSAIMLSVSVLICIGNGISSKKSIFSIVSFVIDVLSLLILIIYLIYLIPNDKNLQDIVLAVIASVVGGALTLAGVAWTIKKQDRDRREEEKKKAKPLFSFIMLKKPILDINGQRVCFDDEGFARFEKNVIGIIENSEKSAFSIEKVYHDNKWWNIVGNKVVLPNKSVYIDFNFTKEDWLFFIEVEDALQNKFYYKIDVLTLNYVNLENSDMHPHKFTVRDIKEISLEKMKDMINKNQKEKENGLIRKEI